MKKSIYLIKINLVTLLLLSFILTGCSVFSSSEEPMALLPVEDLQNHPPHGVYYEIFVRAFADSTGDGIGDLNGVINQLDYLDELGVEGIWFMPISPSPSYHGYDVTDYYGVHEDYGTIEDMKRLVAEAHKRDIKIIVDFVVNHSSSQHPWFQKALAGEEPYRDYYVWADDSTDLNVLGEWDQQIWHDAKGQKFEAVFWDGMPDLNYDSPKLREEIYTAATYWLEEVGIDGFRLDAAKHIYSSHNADDYHQKNVDFWVEFKQEMEKVNPNVLLVGEVWDEATVVAPYFEGLQSSFNFDLSEAILTTINNGKDNGTVDRLIENYATYYNVNPDFIDSTFITNHDMDRVMSEVKGDKDKAKLAASLLLTLPGNPFIYYGEEIGMEGRKPDEFIREPFVWTVDGRAEHQTKWIKSKYNQDTRKKALEAQLDKNDSMFNHYKGMIYARRASDALIKGDLQKADYNENGLLSFKRSTDNEHVLVIHNLTKKAKTITLEETDEDYSKVHYATFQAKDINGEFELPAYSSIILKKK